MKKIALATIIISASISLIGCNNKQIESNGGTNNNNNKITIEEAKEIALKHANLSSEEVSFIRAEKDLDNGMQKYDIEFYYGNKEYDYEINSANGEIIGYDHDVENYDLPLQQTNDSANEITAEQAKEIALKHANLNSDNVSFRRVEIDFDNGVKKYEVEFYYNNIEYNYEIDASSGKIVSYEKE